MPIAWIILSEEESFLLAAAFWLLLLLGLLLIISSARAGKWLFSGYQYLSSTTSEAPFRTNALVGFIFAIALYLLNVFALLFFLTVFIANIGGLKFHFLSIAFSLVTMIGPLLSLGSLLVYNQRRKTNPPPELEEKVFSYYWLLPWALIGGGLLLIPLLWSLIV